MEALMSNLSSSLTALQTPTVNVYWSCSDSSERSRLYFALGSANGRLVFHSAVT